MPEGIGVFDFNREIIDATYDIACAYKLNFAFYEGQGDQGVNALKRSVEHITGSVVTIGDAKRGDIGNTAKAYARAIFSYLGFDAATVSPYLGFDSIEPFLEYEEKGTFILCRTSNPGARDFQSLLCQTDTESRPLFESVALKAREWDKYGNVGLVIGATYPDELGRVRQLIPEIPFLIPGVGAQGGDLASVIRYGLNPEKEGAIINSSRQIIYASQGKDFAEAARKAAQTLRDEINALRK